jgi:hypothetical protein
MDLAVVHQLDLLFRPLAAVFHLDPGFHNKMETISRQAYGFRNFENYRQRVQVLCS